ncbi:MAG: DUF4375 domain-containing protein [Clostridia bacterium]|nr:DUF4375 domain-containing protein [Clostridia bacterium]
MKSRKNKLIVILLLTITMIFNLSGCLFFSSSRRYLKMSVSDLSKLSDGALFEALLYRTEAKVVDIDDMKEDLSALSDAEKVFYVVSYYDIEWQNGGLCQYFTNSSRKTAYLLADCLEKIGADEHKEMYLKFIEDNDINVNDLSSFMTNNVLSFIEQSKRYPFDDYDKAFAKLKPVQEPLMKYVREHINEF